MSKWWIYFLCPVGALASLGLLIYRVYFLFCKTIVMADSKDTN